MKILAKDRQTMLDIALVATGSVESALALAEANGLSLTDCLSDGLELELHGADSGNRVSVIYNAQGIEPATEAGVEDLAACPYGGIGLMAVDVDFEVS